MCLKKKEELKESVQGNCGCFWSRPSKNEVSVGINKANFKGFWLHSSETLFSSSWSHSLWSGQTLFYFSAFFSPCLSRCIPPFLWQPLETCSAVRLELCLCNFSLFFFSWIWEFQMWGLQNCKLLRRPCCISLDTPQNCEEVCHPLSTAASASL